MEKNKKILQDFEHLFTVLKKRKKVYQQTSPILAVLPSPQQWLCFWSNSVSPLQQAIPLIGPVYVKALRSG